MIFGNSMTYISVLGLVPLNNIPRYFGLRDAMSSRSFLVIVFSSSGLFSAFFTLTDFPIYPDSYDLISDTAKWLACCILCLVTCE